MHEIDDIKLRNQEDYNSSEQTFFTMTQQPQWAKAFSLSRLHDHTQDTPQSVGLLWTSDQPETETST
jgi:hypothetical protein